MDITFAGYTFRFWLLTTANRYEPDDFELIETPGGLKARSNHYTFGEGSGSAAGRFEVDFEIRPGGISWTVNARHAEKIKGVRVALEPLPIGTVLVPFEEIELKPGDPGRCFIYPGGYYPIRHISSTDTLPNSGPVRDWAAPFALFQVGDGWQAITAPEYPPRVKKMWIYRKNDFHTIHLYSEADACRRETSYQSPAWRIESTVNWQGFVAGHSAWMSEAFNIPSFAERAVTQPWLKEISLVAILHGVTHDGKICHNFDEMASRLEELALKFSPHKTLLKLAGFEGHIDRHWPDVLPSPLLGGEEGFHRLISTAHRLGCHVIPHLNVWGTSFENPRTNNLLAHQILDQEGRPSTWSYDYDQDEIAEEIMAYISPDASEWRKLKIENIRALVGRGVDAIYLDQTGTFINDLHQWLKKVRPGGIMSGHDYCYFSYAKFNHVKRVVEAYFRCYRMIPYFVVGAFTYDKEFVRDKYRSWFWVKQ